MGRWKYLPHTVFGLSEVREREAPGAAARAAAEHFSARLVPAGSHPHPPAPEGRREGQAEGWSAGSGSPCDWLAAVPG